MKQQIGNNSAICPGCRDILITQHNYDLKYCKCGVLMVDGINETFRICLTGKYAAELKNDDFTLLGIIDHI